MVLGNRRIPDIDIDTDPADRTTRYIFIRPSDALRAMKETLKLDCRRQHWFPLASEMNCSSYLQEFQGAIAPRVLELLWRQTCLLRQWLTLYISTLIISMVLLKEPGPSSIALFAPVARLRPFFEHISADCTVPIYSKIQRYAWFLALSHKARWCCLIIWAHVRSFGTVEFEGM